MKRSPTYFVILFAMMLLAGVGSLAPFSTMAAGSNWESTQFDFGIQWQDPWFEVTEKSVAGDYDMVELKAGDDLIWQDAYGLNWTETDPTTILHKFVARFRSDIPDLAVIQEWSKGGSTGAFPEIITYTSTDGLPVTEAILGRPFDSAPGVFVSASRRSGTFDPTFLRGLNRQIWYRYPGDSALPTPVVTPTPTATRAPTANEIAAAKSLAEALRTTPVTNDELGGYGQYGGASLEPDSSGPASEHVFFSTGGPAHLQDFGYWIYSNSAVAREQFTASMEQQQSKNLQVRIDVTNFMGPDSWLLTDSNGYSAGCYVLVENVVALGTAVGGSTFAPSSAIACDMARIAVIHLAQFTNGSAAIRAQSPTPVQNDQSSSATTGIEALLPTLNDVPDGLVVVADAHRTLDQIVPNYQDPQRTTEQFTEWKWQDNRTRTFGVPSDGVTPADGTVSIYVSIHQFGSMSSSGKALNFSFEDQLGSTGAVEAAQPGIGNASRAMEVMTDVGTEATIYVQKGHYLIRVTVTSLNVDPVVEATTIVRAILTRADSI